MSLNKKVFQLRLIRINPHQLTSQYTDDPTSSLFSIFNIRSQKERKSGTSIPTPDAKRTASPPVAEAASYRTKFTLLNPPHRQWSVCKLFSCSEITLTWILITTISIGRRQNACFSHCSWIIITVFIRNYLFDNSIRNTWCQCQRFVKVLQSCL